MTAGFLEQPTITPQAQALFDDDVKETGYVWNGSRLRYPACAARSHAFGCPEHGRPSRQIHGGEAPITVAVGNFLLKLGSFSSAHFRFFGGRPRSNSNAPMPTEPATSVAPTRRSTFAVGLRKVVA